MKKRRRIGKHLKFEGFVKFFRRFSFIRVSIIRSLFALHDKKEFKRVRHTFSKKSRVLKPWPLFFLLGFTLILIYLAGMMIKITKVTCSDQYGKCSADLQNSLDENIGKSLRRSSSDIKSLLQGKKEIKNSSVRFFLPGSLKVNIVVRKPFCLIKNVNAEVNIIDETGESLGSTSAMSIPPINISEDEMLEQSKDEILFACKIVKSIYYREHILETKVENRELTIDFEDDIKVIFPVEGDYRKLVGSLNLIMSRFQDEGLKDKEDLSLNGKTIDLRFDSPVIR